MTLEEDLRLTLHDQAGQPAAHPDLLDAVRVGVRRAQRRRTAVVGAAVLLAAVVAVPVALARGGPERTGPAPAASATPAPSATPAWPTTAPALRSFPLTPGWLPVGLGERRVDQIGTNMLLKYERDADVFSLEVGPVAGDWEVEGEEEHRSTIGSASAQVRTSSSYDGSGPGDRYVGVRWKPADGQWAQLISLGPTTEADVLRFARNLQAKALPASPPAFRLAEVPPGLVVQTTAPDYLCLARPPLTAESRNQGGLCLAVTSLDEKPTGVPVTVGGRPGVFTGDSEVQIELGGKVVLTVQSDPDLIGLSADELVRFAAGVTVL